MKKDNYTRRDLVGLSTDTLELIAAKHGADTALFLNGTFSKQTFVDNKILEGQYRRALCDLVITAQAGAVKGERHGMCR